MTVIGKALIELAKSVWDYFPLSDKVTALVWIAIGATWCWLIKATAQGEQTVWPRFCAGLISVSLALIWAWGNHVFRLSESPTSIQTLSAFAISLLTLSAISLHTLFYARQPVFPQGVVGILVLRFKGDEDRSLQRRLVETLNSRMGAEPKGSRIEIHSGRDTVAEDKGIVRSHERARDIGERLNASIVIWGDKTDERRLFPRVTVVNRDQALGGVANDTLDVQDISDIGLPTEVVERPLYLSRFIIAYSFVELGDSAKALEYLNNAISQAGPNDDIVDLKAYFGYVALNVAGEDPALGKLLYKAIQSLEEASNAYEQSSRIKWALAKSNLGIAYAMLKKGVRSQNLKRALDSCNAALTVFNVEHSPDEWARVKTNLGTAYGDLQTGNRKDNLQAAIHAFEDALHVRRKEAFPWKWALLEDNLGIACRQLSEIAGEDVNRDISESIRHFENSLTVRTDSNTIAWAETMSNLGNSYASLAPPKTQKALDAQLASLKVFEHHGNRFRAALVQLNLCRTYIEIATSSSNAGDTDSQRSFAKAVQFGKAGISALTPQSAPLIWASAQTTLARAYIAWAKAGSQYGDTLKNAISCLQEALAIYDSAGDECELEQGRASLFLASAYLMQSWHKLDNLVKAKARLEVALSSLCQEAHTDECETIRATLAKVEFRLDVRTVQGDVIGSPTFSPLNRSGLLEITMSRLQRIATDFGLVGSVEVIMKPPNEFYFNYLAREDDLKNPKIETFLKILDDVNDGLTRTED